MKRIAIAIANWFCILTAFIWLPPLFWAYVFFVEREKWKDVFTGIDTIWE